jgi:hypothetical protein
MMLASFPSHLSVVKNSIVGRSALSDTWTIRLTGDGETITTLPLDSDAFEVEARLLPAMGSIKHVPVMWEEITSLPPKGRDTSKFTDKEHLKKTISWLLARDTEELHVTLEFNVPDTIDLQVGGLTYSSPIPGRKASSPISGVDIPSVCSVWLCVTLDISSGRVSEAREIISSRDGTVTIAKKKAGFTPSVSRDLFTASPVTYRGTEPSMWIGIRNGRTAATRNSRRNPAGSL